MTSDLSRFFKHTSIYAIGNMAQRTAGFLLLPLYTTVLTTAEYGILELFYSVAAVLTSVLGVGLAHATLRFYFEYEDEAKAKQVVTTNLIATGVITTTLALFIIQVTYFVINSTPSVTTNEIVHLLLIEHWNSFIIVMATLVLELLKQIGFAYFRAKEYSVRYIFASMVQLLIQLAANIYLVAFANMGVEGVLLGNLISVCFGTLYVLWITLRECKLSFDFPIFKEIFSYSYPFVFNSLVQTVVVHADRFIIAAFFSAELVGVYALAIKFLQILKILVMESFQLGFGSFRFSIIKQGNAKELIAKIGTYYNLLVVSVALGISMFCGEVITLMATSEYADAIPIVPLLILPACITSFGYILQTGILYRKGTKKLVNISLIHGTTLIGLDFILIPNMGLEGAAIAMLGSGIVHTYATYRYSQALYPMQYHFGRMFKILAFAILTYIFSQMYMFDNIWLSLGYKLICGMAFALLVITTQVLYGDEWQALKNLRRKTDH